MMEEIASDEVLQQAYDWLCKRRKDYSHNNDVWDVRWRWEEIKPQLQVALLAGTYRLSAVDRIRGEERTIELWSSLDALVLKAAAIVLNRHLKPYLSANCYHLAGTGGAKAAVRVVAENLADNTFVFRSDVQSYYASIDHDILFALVRQYVTDKRLLDLLWGYIHRTVYDGGIYEDIHQGIALGCSLSPLMGALYLKQLDERMAETGLFYARYMDDWVVLAPTRWKLRKAIRVVNETLAELEVEKHPDKTSIGYIDRGFDFLGYHFSRAGLTPARKTVQNFFDKLARLNEQQASAERLGQYVQNWLRWLRAGVKLLLVRSFNGWMGAERYADTGRWGGFR